MEAKNSIYFNYSIPSDDLSADLKAKILINESKLVLNEDSIIDLTGPMIEADIKNLYIFSPSGKVTNFFYNEAYGLINFKTQKLSFYSMHDLQSIDLKNLLSIGEERFNLPEMQVEHKGEMTLSALMLNNAISIQTKDFFVPILQSHKIKFDKANIYIVDLDSIYGLMPSTFMNEKIQVNLSGKDLLKEYDLTLSTNINLDPGDFIIDSPYLQVLKMML